MHTQKLSRRSVLAKTGALLGAAVATQALAPAKAVAGPFSRKPFLFCLNTSTIRGQKLGIVKEIEITAKAGYDAIEPWVDSIEEYVKGGGSLGDLRKRIDDHGLIVADAIGFPEWIVDDESRRNRGFERAKREMEMVARIGGKRFACPPAGATDAAGFSLARAAERYRALLEIGDRIGILPQLELWGFSKNMNRLGECACVAVDTGHPKACILADVYHLYKGGSNYHGLRLLAAETVQMIHMNDFPANPPREKIDDSFRVYPGDGTGEITGILRDLRANGGQKTLSLEVFNRDYWKQDPFLVAKTGLAKMKAAANAALRG
ncbi:MAG TPA: sugar phosphate isomerase/epimerase [Verrucomicrobiae bacterium]|nr:sugar phosphate isomerase/epimerase [Verrucomicrobiae bacterium]